MIPIQPGFQDLSSSFVLPKRTLRFATCAIADSFDKLTSTGSVQAGRAGIGLRKLYCPCQFERQFNIKKSTKTINF